MHTADSTPFRLLSNPRERARERKGVRKERESACVCVRERGNVCVSVGERAYQRRHRHAVETSLQTPRQSARESKGERVRRERVCARVCERKNVCVCVRVCERERMCVCAWVCEREHVSV